MKYLNDLLPDVDCYSKSMALARCAMPRIAGGVEFDLVAGAQYPLLLSVLIDYERRTAQQPNFYNIWALVARNNVDEELMDDPNFDKLREILQPEILDRLLFDFGLWLEPFRLMKPATAA